MLSVGDVQKLRKAIHLTRTRNFSFEVFKECPLKTLGAIQTTSLPRTFTDNSFISIPKKTSKIFPRT